jgi:hypothetical protein
VVEQQHDQALDRDESLVVLGAGEPLAGLGGEQAPLAVVEQHTVLVDAASDAGNQLTCRREHVREAVDALLGDLRARVGRERELVEREPFEHARDGAANEIDAIE